MNLGRLKPAWKSVTKSGFYDTLNTPRLYVASYVASRKDRPRFQEVKTYCMFVGNTRSGGSLTSAVLDAHPNVILADGMDALRFVSAGFRREQIFQILLDHSRRQSKGGRISAGRSYLVPGQSHGRAHRLEVIGDVKSAISTERLARDPGLLARLQDTMGDVQVKLIHVVRNPFDSISDMTRRSGRTLESAIQYYVANCKTVADIRRRVGPTSIFVVKNDELIARTEATLRALCDFLGIAVVDGHVDACKRFMCDSSVRSRHLVGWRPELVDAVQSSIIDQFDFVRGYSYEA